MFSDDNDQDPISNALRSRRIPHGRSRNNAKSGKASGRTSFDPLRAIGVYEVKYGKATKTKRQNHQRHDSETESTASVSSLTIHGLTPEETGLMASFDVGGIITGIAVLAGSRSGLKKIVADLEREDKEDEEDEDSADEEQEGSETENRGTEEYHDAAEEEPSSALEKEDERINRRAKAFEKNSFRNPKFWMHWRARVTNGDGKEVNESNKGYIVFSGNDCATFEGTMTSDVLGWDNMRINGHKVKPHAGKCPMEWTDLD